MRPSLRNPNFLVLSSRRIIFQRWIGRLGGRDLKILDVGGRYQPYRPLFGNHIAQYVACDILKTEFVDVVANGELLPFAANTFDVAIATQVLEYISLPHAAAEQIHTVLKPGGSLLMSAVAMAPRFGDEEYWRFTPHGIRSMLSAFNNVQIIAETSSIGGLCRTLNLATHTFAHFGILRKLHEFTVCPCLNLLGMAIENLKLTRNDQFTPNYSVLAIK